MVSLGHAPCESQINRLITILSRRVARHLPCVFKSSDLVDSSATVKYKDTAPVCWWIVVATSVWWVFITNLCLTSAAGLNAQHSMVRLFKFSTEGNSRRDTSLHKTQHHIIHTSMNSLLYDRVYSSIVVKQKIWRPSVPVYLCWSKTKLFCCLSLVKINNS